MTHQQPLIPTHTGPDIWRRYRLNGTRAINAAPWQDAYARGSPVGTCRHTPNGVLCGGYLMPGPPYTVGNGRRMYPTVCATCHHETAAAGPAPTKKRKTI